MCQRHCAWWPSVLCSTAIRVHHWPWTKSVQLCFEVHGQSGNHYNLISDKWTSVIALYSAGVVNAEMNVITKIGVRTQGTNWKQFACVVLNCRLILFQQRSLALPYFLLRVDVRIVVHCNDYVTRQCLFDKVERSNLSLIICPYLPSKSTLPLLGAFSSPTALHA